MELNFKYAYLTDDGIQYIDKDTIYGETKYGQQQIASGSMVYKHEQMPLSQARPPSSSEDHCSKILLNTTKIVYEESNIRFSHRPTNCLRCQRSI